MTPYGYLWFDKAMERRFTHRHPNEHDAAIGEAMPVYLAARPEEKDMVLVPREPTKEMVVAAYEAQQAVGALTIQKIYRAMLSASSPLAPQFKGPT